MYDKGEKDENILDFKIDFSYEGKKEKSLDDVIGSISKGDCIVLCGESGCGKSTLLRCLNHLIPEFYDGIFNGYILVNSNNIENKNIGESWRIDFVRFSRSKKSIFYNGKRYGSIFWT